MVAPGEAAAEYGVDENFAEHLLVPALSRHPPPTRPSTPGPGEVGPTQRKKRRAHPIPHRSLYQRVYLKHWDSLSLPAPEAKTGECSLLGLLVRMSSVERSQTATLKT